MAKIVLACPACGKYVEAKTGFLASKKAECVCGYVIDLKSETMTSRSCEHCGNTVVFNQTKGKNAKCPVCNTNINDLSAISNLVEFTCGSCGCICNADKNVKSYKCLLCGEVNDVEERVAMHDVKRKGLINIIKYEEIENDAGVLCSGQHFLF